jgi:hypothetical protein
MAGPLPTLQLHQVCLKPIPLSVVPDMTISQQTTKGFNTARRTKPARTHIWADAIARITGESYPDKSVSTVRLNELVVIFLLAQNFLAPETSAPETCGSQQDQNRIDHLKTALNQTAPQQQYEAHNLSEPQRHHVQARPDTHQHQAHGSSSTRPLVHAYSNRQQHPVQQHQAPGSGSGPQPLAQQYSVRDAQHQEHGSSPQPLPEQHSMHNTSTVQQHHARNNPNVQQQQPHYSSSAIHPDNTEFQKSLIEDLNDAKNKIIELSAKHETERHRRAMLENQMQVGDFSIANSKKCKFKRKTMLRRNQNCSYAVRWTRA